MIQVRRRRKRKLQLNLVLMMRTTSSQVTATKSHPLLSKHNLLHLGILNLWPYHQFNSRLLPHQLFSRSSSSSSHRQLSRSNKRSLLHSLMTMMTKRRVSNQLKNHSLILQTPIITQLSQLMGSQLSQLLTMKTRRKSLVIYLEMMMSIENWYLKSINFILYFIYTLLL